MDKHLKKREKAKAAMVRIEDFVLQFEKDLEVDINEFAVRESLLKKAFNDYSEVQDVIEDKDQNQETDRVDVERRYCSLAAKIKTILQTSQKLQTHSDTALSNENSNSQTSIQPQQKSLGKNVKLPNISIPTFSGKYDEWKSFEDLFVSLIHENGEISNVQKFFYLKSSLRLEPLSLINNLQLTNDNYNIAWDLLKKRYENKLVIINTHINALLDVSTITKMNSEIMRQFITQIKQNKNALKSLNVPVEQWDLILIFIYCKKLDFYTRSAFELEKKDIPTLDEFLEFLEKRCSAFEASVDNKQKFTKVTNHSTQEYNSNRKCAFCKLTNHTLYKCLRFIRLGVPDRKQFIIKANLCLNCFGNKHSIDECNSAVCRFCGQRHHSLLHQKNENTNNHQNVSQASQKAKNETLTYTVHSVQNEPTNITEKSQNNSETVQSDNSTCLIAHRDQSQVLLATAKVTLIAENGNKVEARALLDSASQTTFVTAAVVEGLQSATYEHSVEVSGINNGVTKINKMTNLIIESHSQSFQCRASCAVLKRITCSLPQLMVNKTILNIPKDLKLADPQFHLPSGIDMLIGADLFFEIIDSGLIRLGSDLPTLQNSHLGWIIGGPIPNPYCATNISFTFFTNTIQIDELVQKFWQLEEVATKNFISQDDKLCEKIFVSHTKRLENGAFEVMLPFRQDDDFLMLGDSYNLAARRFYSLEKRLSKNKELFTKYKEFLDEYINLNHGKYIPFTPFDKKYFIPHHCIIREDSLTTKLRVVFDASMKTTSGYSLNDIMLKGNTVQPDLFDIICRFRTFMFVLTCDIEKMFRQVRINPSQLFLQNILWRENSNEDLKCIELQTVTYGTNAAPYLATRCLMKLATEESVNYPLASSAILNQCYMDDILGGANTKTELQKLRSELSAMLLSGGFKLHKWCTNDYSIFDTDTNGSNVDGVNFLPHSTCHKVLGLYWCPLTDEFKVTIPFSNSGNILTKRFVLSCIARMFDPLGFIGPVVTKAKIFMQKIWISKIDWDETLNPDLCEGWTRFAETIPILSNVKVPRNLLLSNSLSEIQIHGFSDACLSAYGTCIYLRSIYINKEVSCNLICSRSRVAPLKTISLPRLELCGALLLARLLHRVLSLLSLKISEIFCWTDSQIVLHWLNKSPSCLNTFVANRVSEIQELTNISHWRYIPTSDNPADYISRGLEPSRIVNCTHWWNGPKLLSKLGNEFNIIPSTEIIDDIPELRKTVMYHFENDTDFMSILSRFSNFIRLQRSIAYCLRFIYNCRNKNNRCEDMSLTVFELKNTLLILVKRIQLQYFSTEMSKPNMGKALENSQIKCLNPFIDENEILRVGGRLANANIPDDQKFPILLPSNNIFVKLLIEHEHKVLHHAGPQTVLNHIRLRYWIVNGLHQVKKILKNCVICHRFKAVVAKQLMGNLPKERVTTVRAFYDIGVDYAGPFQTKESRLRKSVVSKSYIALFICMSTKAVHIELISSLSTEAFLMTFKRFISRRGIPHTIFSDNGTTFQGARNQLHDIYELFNVEDNLSQIKNFMTILEIRWKFLPPNSPHWGGLWEVGIKSIKYHIRRVIGNIVLTFEQMTTVLSQIEAVLNSRPLCSLSTDPSDLTSLTPGHFLIGEPLTCLPEEILTEVNKNRISHWRHCTKIMQHFWKRWSVEYLNKLQSRPKWMKVSENLCPNMLVLVKEDNSPPLQWNLARILEIFPGQDNKVRVVKILTKNGIFIRPISKLCPLPRE